LRGDDIRGHAKYSEERRRQTVEYYQEHGRSISRTIKALGFPEIQFCAYGLMKICREIKGGGIVKQTAIW